MDSNPDDSRCIVELNSGRVTGLASTAQASLLSLFAVLYVLLRVALNYRRNIRHPPGAPWRLIRSSTDAYMLNHLVAELVVAVGGILDAVWAIEGRTYCGTVCSAQGALAQIGISAAAPFMMAIAINAWWRVYTGRPERYSAMMWVTVSIFFWGYVVLFATVGWSVHPDFYQPATIWCWIGANYPRGRLFGQYILLWVCAFGSILAYGQLYLWCRGNLEFLDTTSGTKIKFHFPAQVPDDNDDDDEREEAWKILLFPFCYTMQVLGFSITRWMSFQDRSLNNIHEPELAGMAAASLFFRWVFRLSGFVTVVLLLKLRPNVLLFGTRGVLNPDDPRAIADQQNANHANISAVQPVHENTIQLNDLNEKQQA